MKWFRYYFCVANLRHSPFTDCIVLALLWVCCTADLCITCRLLAATHILALVAVCLQEVSPQYRSVCGSHVRLQLFSSSYSYQKSQLHVKSLNPLNPETIMSVCSVSLWFYTSVQGVTLWVIYQCEYCQDIKSTYSSSSTCLSFLSFLFIIYIDWLLYIKINS